MLYKKELEQIPIQNYPGLPPKEKKSDKYVASIQVLNLERSGKILFIDIFLREDKNLKLRFVSDGKSFLACREWPAKQWCKNIPSNLLEDSWSSSWDIDASERDIKLAHEFLKIRQESWRYRPGIIDEMDYFAKGINAEKQAQAMDRKYSKMKSHFAMFPDYPPDLKKFCETNVFGFTYIFISKIQKGSRKAACGHCGHEFVVPKEERTGGNGSCPTCQMKGKYRSGWRSGGPTDKAQICIAYNVRNQLLIRWTKITRTYIEGEVRYSFEDYYRNLYLKTPKGPVIYAYKYQSINAWGWEWYRQKNGTVHYGESFVYTNNLTEVFGNPYYRVDLQAGLKGSGKVDFMSLLDNLKNTPAAEYLFKLGLIELAARLWQFDLSKGIGFSGMLGVSKQYLPMYRKYNVTPTEHQIIKLSKTWVNESLFEKLRQLDPYPYEIQYISKMLQSMSFERFVNYFHKQKQLGRRKEQFGYYLRLYKDYLSMSETLKVDLSRKSVRFPSDLQEAHDQIVARFNLIKAKKEDRKFKQAIKKLYVGMPDFYKGDFCIVYPQLRSDLVKEGQSLKHCVGGEHYWKSHMAGTRMIFFVRKIAEPKAPFFTLEIDMKNLMIGQLYGFSNKPAPPEVRKFANEFLKRLKPKSQENKVRIMVPA
ncbi:hypothetical protein JCM15765_14930 [Paradesulfitobacterium aromaticivorans]